MIAHDHRVMRPEILHQPLALIKVDRRSFIVVITDVADKADGRLRHRQEPALHRRNRHAGPCMGVQHASDVLPRLVDRAVNHIARDIDAVIGVGLGNDVALDIDLDQARCRDLLVKQPVEIDQQMVGAGNARGDVVIDQVGHGIGVDQAIAGGEIEPGLPFLLRYVVADRLEICCVIHGRFSPFFRA